MRHIEIDVPSQQLVLRDGSEPCICYPISTSLKGLGEQQDSGQTPRGWHQVRAKIGAEQPLNTVFIGRRPTGEIYTSNLARQYPQRDWILSRLLWLSGMEPGFNRGEGVDTMRRYIYIHGCPDEISFAKPASHGCIRVHNHDMLELFNWVTFGERVLIRG